MIFYEIEILSVPNIVFAYGMRLNKHKNSFLCPEDYFEISICKKGKILFEYSDGKKEIACPGMLIPTFGGISYSTSQYEDEPQEHLTVGVSANYKSVKYSSEAECNAAEITERVKNGNVVLIPFHCPAEDTEGKITGILKKIIQLYSSEKCSNGIYALAYWYMLTGELTDFVLRKITCAQSNISPAELAVAEKAVRFIGENYTSALSVNTIANNLGISGGYLHRIFKRVKGTGITEYINQQRISAAAELIKNKNASLKDAAHSVGIEDEAYMSRLFKKTMGINYREYVNREADKGKM